MKAFYPGSFDPFTVGHMSIATRTLELFGNLVIGVGYNHTKINEKTVEERVNHIMALFSDNPKVAVIAYDGLTAEIARQQGAGVLVRGVRNSIDFEKEKELADINLEVFGMPTILIPCEPQLSYISSSLVRELTHFGYNPKKFLPD